MKLQKSAFPLFDVVLRVCGPQIPYSRILVSLSLMHPFDLEAV